MRNEGRALVSEIIENVICELHQVCSPPQRLTLALDNEDDVSISTAQTGATSHAAPDVGRTRHSGALPGGRDRRRHRGSESCGTFRTFLVNFPRNVNLTLGSSFSTKRTGQKVRHRKGRGAGFWYHPK